MTTETIAELEARIAADQKRLEELRTRERCQDRERRQNTGHGHVFPRPDGVRARCGGPIICAECSRDAAMARDQERDELSRLRAENERLRAENERLRNAAVEVSLTLRAALHPRETPDPEVM